MTSNYEVDFWFVCSVFCFSLAPNLHIPFPVTFVHISCGERITTLP